MKNHGIIAAIVIFVLIIAGMFTFAFLKKSEIAAPVSNTPETPTPTPYDSITRLEARHYYIDGTHTLVGEVLMPTPCDLLNWNTTIAESMPEQVTVDFVVVNTADMCAQVITPQLFSVSFDASENASIRATLNGRALELNMTPAAPGEKPEDYEFSGKG
jgi:hypothetical protein